MQQRYYDPELGLFPSTDPVTALSPGGAFNRYWYANANPFRNYDPDGRQAQSNENHDNDKPECKTLACRRQEQEDRHRRTDSPFTGASPRRNVGQNDQSYLQRVLKRFKSTNQAIPGALTFPGTTVATGGVTANSVDGITAWQAYRLIRADPLSRGPNLIRLSMTSAINFVAVSAAWEAGILGGSMIYEAPTQYGSNKTVGEDLGDTIDNAMRSGP